MKYCPRFTYTFTPGSSTLDLSANSGFTIKGLLAVLNTTVAAPVYVAGTSGLGYSALTGGNVLTLQTSLAGMASTDNLVFFYDDGLNTNTAATGIFTKTTDGTNTAAVKAASTAAAATDPALVVAVSPNNPIAATQSGTWNATINTALPAGANVIGGVTQSGTWNIGTITTLPALPAGSNSIGTVVNIGDVAAGATDAGAPQKIGGQARITNPTAVTDGQRVNAIFDKLGKQIVVGAVRDLKARQRTNIAASTAETTIVTGIASTFNDLYGLVITNNGSATMSVTIRDAAAATPVMVFEVPATDTRGFMLPVDSAVPQTTVNTAWTATCTPNATSVDITAFYVKNI